MEESKEFQEVQKPVRLSLHLICKRHLPEDSQKSDQEQIIASLNKITHLRLDRERIGEIDSLELLGDKCTNLYLQCNLIEVIQNLDCLKNLSFISLANNKISKIENIRHLKKLLCLDLSENQISEVDSNEIPPSVAILNLHGNPCSKYPNYRLNLIHDLPRIRQIDHVDVTNTERRSVGIEVSSDDDDDDDDDGDGHDKDTAESFQTMAAGMMLRSQKRTEDAFREHKIHTSELDDLRITWKVPPSARSSVTAEHL